MQITLTGSSNIGNAVPITRKSLTKHSKAGMRGLLSRLRKEARSDSPKGKRKDKNYKRQSAEYGTLKRRLGKVKTLRVKASYRKKGWFYRFAVTHGGAYWINFIQFNGNDYFQRILRRYHGKHSGIALSALSKTLRDQGKAKQAKI